MAKLTQQQIEILDSCANGDELFYFLFAEVNYGGQVFSSKLKETDDSFALYDDKPYPIKYEAMRVAQDIVFLANKGFLKCYHYDRWEEFIPTLTDLSVYENYDCLRFEDHMDKFGYGPHVFEATPKGIDEMLKEDSN